MRKRLLALLLSLVLILSLCPAVTVSAVTGAESLNYDPYPGSGLETEADPGTYDDLVTDGNIAFASLPVKTVYAKGEVLDLTGLTVLEGGIDVTNEITAEGFDPSAIGTQTVTLHYGDAQTSYDVHVFGFTSVNLTLEGKIDVNFHAQFPGVGDAYTPGALFFDANPSAAQIESAFAAGKMSTGSVMADGSYRFVHSDIAAKEMNDLIYVVPVAKLPDGTAVFGRVSSISPAQYVLTAFATYEDETLRTMLVDMLNYGAAAQKHFGYRTGALATSYLTEAQKALATQTEPEVASCMAVFRDALTDSKLTLQGASLTLENELSINIYAKPVTGQTPVSAELLIFDAYTEGGTHNAATASRCVPMSSRGDALFGSISNIPAKLMRKPFYARVHATYADGSESYSGVLRYSVETYAHTIKTGDYTESIKTLTDMMMRYGDSAEEYFAGREPSDNETPYVLNYYLYGSSDTPVRRSVQDAINAYIQPKIGANLDLTLVPGGDWKQQAYSALQGGEKIDIFFTADWLNFVDHARQGLFTALNDDDGPNGNLLEQHGRGILETMDEKFFLGTALNGVNYAVPTNKELIVPLGYLYNIDAAEAIGMDPDTITCLADFEPHLQKYSEDFGLPGFLSDGTMGFEPWVAGFANLAGNALTMKLDPADDGSIDLNVYNIYEDEETIESLRLMHKWHNAGYIHPDSYRPDFGPRWCEEFSSGNWLIVAAPLKGYGISAQENMLASGNPDLRIGEIYGQGKYAQTVNAGGSMLAIPATSEDPAKAMQFINLMHTDGDLLDLMLYGVPEEHWTLADDGRVEIIEPENGDLPWCYAHAGSWTMGNTALQKVFVGEDPDKFRQLQQFTKGSVAHASLGFHYELPESLQTRWNNVKNIVGEYQRALFTGSLDPDAVLPELRNELRNAGIDQLQLDMQAQFNDWYENLNGPIAPMGIRFDYDEMTVYTGQGSLAPLVYTANGHKQVEVTLSPADPASASVISVKGMLVTGLTEGIATLHATYAADNGSTYTTEMTVYAVPPVTDSTGDVTYYRVTDYAPIKRAGAGTAYKIVEYATPGEIVGVVEMQNGWVKLTDGTYMVSRTLDGVRDRVYGKLTISNIMPLNYTGEGLDVYIVGNRIYMDFYGEPNTTDGLRLTFVDQNFNELTGAHSVYMGGDGLNLLNGMSSDSRADFTLNQDHGEVFFSFEQGPYVYSSKAYTVVVRANARADYAADDPRGIYFAESTKTIAPDERYTPVVMGVNTGKAVAAELKIGTGTPDGIFTIENDDTVVGVSEGVGYITATHTFEDHTYTASSMRIMVSADGSDPSNPNLTDPYGIYFAQPVKQITMGKTYTPTVLSVATAKPVPATLRIGDRTNATVIDITNDGTSIVGTREGVAYITAQYTYGSKTYTSCSMKFVVTLPTMP